MKLGQFTPSGVAKTDLVVGDLYYYDGALDDGTPAQWKRLAIGTVGQTLKLTQASSPTRLVPNWETV